MKNIIQSAGFIMYHNDHSEPLFLLLHYNAGHWDFAKGKIEDHESLLETATRELFEETGLVPHTIGDFSYKYTYDLKDYNGEMAKKQVTLFLSTTQSTVVILSNEHTDSGWFTFADALTRLTHIHSQEALKAAWTHLRST